MKVFKIIALLSIFGLLSFVGTDSVLGDSNVGKLSGEKAEFLALDGKARTTRTTRTTTKRTTKTTRTRSVSLEEIDDSNTDA